MITLYHSPKTRADSIVWLLEELGVAYALRDVDWRRAVPASAMPPTRTRTARSRPWMTVEKQFSKPAPSPSI